MGVSGERIEEGRIPGAKEAISLDETELKEKENCFCKIIGRKVGTGFFCKIKYKDTLIPVLMTNYHIIDDKFIEENNYIKFYINNNSQIIDNINKNDILYSSPNKDDKYDIMIIKLKENDDYDIKYLEIDENIFKYNSELHYKNDPIYILHYPNSEKAKVSYGKGFEKINDFDMKHFCNTEPGSSGGPILSSMTNKVIGIHKSFNNSPVSKNIYNVATFLKFPLNELNRNIKEIKMETNINEEDINKLIFEKKIDRNLMEYQEIII